jgi:acyl-CoA synthetase (AMP-forming)/AMP-acid ligase II
VLRDGAILGPEDVGPEITAWARERMANFKVPRTFRIVDSLPLNATGKVAKAELRATMLGEQTKVGGH